MSQALRSPGGGPAVIGEAGSYKAPEVQSWEGLGDELVQSLPVTKEETGPEEGKAVAGQTWALNLGL